MKMKLNNVHKTLGTDLRTVKANKQTGGKIIQPNPVFFSGTVVIFCYNPACVYGTWMRHMARIYFIKASPLQDKFGGTFGNFLPQEPGVTCYLGWSHLKSLVLWQSDGNVRSQWPKWIMETGYEEEGSSWDRWPLWVPPCIFISAEGQEAPILLNIPPLKGRGEHSEVETNDLISFFFLIFISWLHRVVVAAHGLFVATSKSSLVARGLSSCGTWVQQLQPGALVGPVTCGILVPLPGIKPTSFALTGGFLTTGPPRKSWKSLLLGRERQKWAENQSWLKCPGTSSRNVHTWRKPSGKFILGAHRLSLSSTGTSWPTGEEWVPQHLLQSL